MSRAISVFHGRFGRATLYSLNRPFNTHAHREGHLIFHVGGADGYIDVSGQTYELTPETLVCVSPWEPHNFVPLDFNSGSVFFVLYVNAEWFAPDGGADRLIFGRAMINRTPTLDRHIRRVAAMVQCGQQLAELDRELRALIDACFEQSWGPADDNRPRLPREGVSDFRVRKAIRLMHEGLAAGIELDGVARESGLSRPHFYKLFRTQTGLTPNLFLNMLLMERALEWLTVGERPVAEIGFDLGFSSQSGFTRFFAANVGMAPTDYRRATHIL